MVALNVQQLKKKCLTETLTDETLLYSQCSWLFNQKSRKIISSYENMQQRPPLSG